MRARDPEVVRLLIADDHPLVRSGYRKALEGDPGLEVVGEAGDGREALKLCRVLVPDVVLMDVDMPEMDGFTATRLIKQELPGVAVVMVTVHESPDYLLRALKSGAAGYVLKDAPLTALITAIRKAAEGDFPLNRDLSVRLLRQLIGEDGARPSPQATNGTRAEPLPGSLTPRELDVLRLLARGGTNREIAERMMISPGTVKNHVQSIIGKLGVSDRTQAAVRAVEAGLRSS